MATRDGRAGRSATKGTLAWETPARPSRHVSPAANSQPYSFPAMLAPTDFQPTRRRSLQPDLLVVRRRDLGGTAITEPLVLAVEVLSPSTRSVDLLLKRGVYAESGVEAYWVVDPLEPSVQAWRLLDGEWADAGRASGDGVLELTIPFPFRVQPSALLDD